MSPIFIFLVGLVLGLGLPITAFLLRPELDSFLLGAFGGAFIIMLGYEMWMEAIRRARWIAHRDGKPPPVAPPGPHWRIDPPPKYVDPPTIPEIEPQPAPATDEEESPLAAEVEQAEAEVVDLEKRRSAS